jgi:hypothetical protein
MPACQAGAARSAGIAPADLVPQTACDIRICSGADEGCLRTVCTPESVPPELAKVIRAWPDLPAETIRAIIELVDRAARLLGRNHGLREADASLRKLLP